MRIVVTSGDPFLDIDAYAGCLAYAELLKLQGKNAVAVSDAPLSLSINETVKSWGSDLETKYIAADTDRYVLIDISDPDYFDSFVEIDQVIGVIDHHYGFEKYWKKKIGDEAVIDLIGAASTLVFEQWQKSGLLQKLSKISAKLLVCAILDNTLNFKASVTSTRDKEAYNVLLKMSKLPENWPEIYFRQCQKDIGLNLEDAINYDKKEFKFKGLDDTALIGQVTVWSGEETVNNSYKEMVRVMSKLSDFWMLNVLSISNQKSYFVCNKPKLQKYLTKVFSAKFKDNVGVTARPWLRKEIRAQDANF